jgi:hypothetical protein
MALRLATELQDRGVTHLGFELGDSRTKYDIDVYTRHPDGAIDYGYQLKDVDSVSGIRKAASKSAFQMDYPMSHRVAILDVHESLENLTPRIFEGVAHLAQRSEVTTYSDLRMALSRSHLKTPYTLKRQSCQC